MRWHNIARYPASSCRSFVAFQVGTPNEAAAAAAAGNTQKMKMKSLSKFQIWMKTWVNWIAVAALMVDALGGDRVLSPVSGGAMAGPRRACTSVKARHVVSEVDVFLTDVEKLSSPDAIASAGDAMVNVDKMEQWRQLILLQYPLRSQERPYPVYDTKTVRVKPRNQRIEVDIPISERSANYDKQGSNRQGGPFSLMPNLTLRSKDIDLQTKYMIGMVRGGKLVLAPLDRAVQLRPKMSYLDGETRHEDLTRKDAESAVSNSNSMELFTVQI